MVSINMPSLIIIGFLIGVILIYLGTREKENMSRRNSLLKSGIVVVGIMIPVTPISWYVSWMYTTGLELLFIDYVIIAVAIVIGILVIYQGFKSYTNGQ
jgi:hypothetical protein